MKIIEDFNQIRDIPYRIPVDSNEEDCCCNGKAKQLKKLLEQEGLEVRYRVCEFHWSDLGLPEEIKKQIAENLATHVYLEVLINDKWVVVDPTWDKGLEQVLPVNDWDGIGDTKIAVPVIKTYDLGASEKIMTCEAPGPGTVSENKNTDFEITFNKWLQAEREGKN
ncbi:MAG: hypothetical protein ABIH67_04330 [Candidatus Uhrbacteria bacterium]